MPIVTLFYAGLLGLISLVLSFRVGSMRGKTGVSIGDGGRPELLLEMRRHGNFTEYVPLALVLLALLELSQVSHTAIHVMGAALVIARIAHPIGLRVETMSGLGRLIGAAGTALVTLVASVWAIVVFVLFMMTR